MRSLFNIMKLDNALKRRNLIDNMLNFLCNSSLGVIVPKDKSYTLEHKFY